MSTETARWAVLAVTLPKCCLQTELPSPCFVHLQGRVWLIDLNPFGEVTDSLLFSWEELTSGEITQQQVSHHLTQTKDVVVWTATKTPITIIWPLPGDMHVQEGPAFRYTNSEVTVQPSPCLSYRIPRDFVDLSTGEDAYKLIDFLKLVGCCYASWFLKGI